MRFHHSFLLAILAGSFCLLKAQTPLPEHPRPDFLREQWINLNGVWDFGFDSLDTGLQEGWFKLSSLPEKITVPFSWGSPLSGLEDLSDIAWYSREIQIPEDWTGERTFLVIGACDWKSELWIDGKHVGAHQGGYNQFEFDLTPFVKPGQVHRLCLSVDDTEHSFKLNGKQGYGKARGIWQTVYLERRGAVAFEYIHFTPDIDRETVRVSARLDKPAPKDLEMNIIFPGGELPVFTALIKKGETASEFQLAVPNPHLWELDDPYLYDVKIQLRLKEQSLDELQSYFGMRKISIMDMPENGHPYVALNNRPIYLQLCLDQAYHPEGFYTYPSDEFMRDEIIRSKKIGLNGNRIHIKVEIPRKLYWADKLGLLIMADVPNFWGEPGDSARNEWAYAMREMIRRDYNHPSIFSWVLFHGKTVWE